MLSKLFMLFVFNKTLFFFHVVFFPSYIPHFSSDSALLSVQTLLHRLSPPYMSLPWPPVLIKCSHTMAFHGFSPISPWEKVLPENIISNNLAVFIMSNHIIAVSVALTKILVKFKLKKIT